MPVPITINFADESSTRIDTRALLAIADLLSGEPDAHEVSQALDYILSVVLHGDDDDDGGVDWSESTFIDSGESLRSLRKRLVETIQSIDTEIARCK